MEWTTETNPRECWNVKKKSTQEGKWQEKYKWNSDKNEILVKTVIRRKKLVKKWK